MFAHLQALPGSLLIVLASILGFHRIIVLFEETISEASRAKIGNRLLTGDFRKGTRKVLEIYLNLNNTLFGKKIFSLRSFFVSVILTLAWGACFTINFALHFPNFSHALHMMVNTPNLRNLAMLALLVVLIIDYLSISMTRKIYRVTVAKGKRSFLVALVSDLTEQYWQHVREYLEKHIGYSGSAVPKLVFSLFANSPTVQTSRWACEQVLERADPTVLPQLIQHCRRITADDVRNLFLRWHIRLKPEKKDNFKECVAQACSALGTLLAGTMPSDLALATVWHDFGNSARADQQSVAASLRELPSGGREVVWSQLGPAAREAWREDLFDQVREEPELAQGLVDFACLWLEQTAFAEVEPVLLRLMYDEDHLAFANQLASVGPRQKQLRAKGLVRSAQGTLDVEAPIGQGEDAHGLPSVGAQTWLGDPSVERLIHRALSQIEEEFCCEYLTTWGEDEETHTARLLTLTQGAISNVSRQFL